MGLSAARFLTQNGPEGGSSGCWGVIISMQNAEKLSREQIEALLEASEEIRFEGKDRAETGGLIPQGAPLVGGVFRIDHDQAFQSTINLRYQRPRNEEWIALLYRYDSGLVVSGVPDAGFALSLTPNQQVSIGLA